MDNKILIFCIVSVIFRSGLTCFSNGVNKKNDSKNEGDANWVPYMDELSNNTKEVAKKIMALLDSDLGTEELCRRLKNLYGTTSETDRQQLHIVWWREIDCGAINKTRVDPIYPFFDQQKSDPNPEKFG